MSMPSPNTASAIAANAGSAADIERSTQFKIEGLPSDSGDAAQFQAALERHMSASSAARPGAGNEGSLGDKIMVRASDLASEVKKDQQYVSKVLEQATRSGNSMDLMKAMMALHDYQMRVQFISKTASKATSALDQLTKLQ